MHLAFEKNEPVATRRGVCVLEWAGSRPNAVATKACRSWSAYRLRPLTINALVFVAAAVRGQTFFHLLAQSLCTEPLQRAFHARTETYRAGASDDAHLLPHFDKRVNRTCDVLI